MNKLHCGNVAIVGRPNTGKSTLLNRILEEKVAIVSDVPQTTRYKVRGIFTDQRGQIIFVDTPGMHMPKHRMGKCMVQQLDQAIEECDLLIHLVDTTEPPGQEERMLVDKIKQISVPIILGLNKTDITPKYLDSYIKLWEELKGKKITELTDNLILLPISALKGTNIDQLIEEIFSHLPKGELLYAKDTLSDLPEKLAIADLIREKLFKLMRQELPHSLAVYVDQIEPKRNKLTYIRAVIMVETDSQKQIVVGKRGNILKVIGEQARKDIEELLERRVFLETHVKVKPGWRQNAQVLKELGYI